MFHVLNKSIKNLKLYLKEEKIEDFERIILT